MKNNRRIARRAAATALVFGGMAFQGCPAAGLLNECFGEDTISAGEYDDLNVFEQLLYDETGCGRYEPRVDF
ncbi:MAG: hypothetical protein J5J06_19800 [Phycisphaerae bacterium]|nr:hypothetical protein [Phycisphaerae bacterium]